MKYFACLTVWAGAALAQPFVNAYGTPTEDLAYSGVVMLDGSHLLVGETGPIGPLLDALFIKTDGVGTPLWSVALTGADEDVAKDVVALPDLSFVVTGHSRSFGAGADADAWIGRFDPFGTKLWGTVIDDTTGDDFAEAVVATMDGGFAICGYTYSYGPGADLFIARFDAAGTLLWYTAFGGPLDDMGHDLYEAPDGSFTVVGETSSIGWGAKDGLIASFDPFGFLLGAYSMGSGSDEIFWGISPSFADTTTVIVGESASLGPIVRGLVFKVDTAGLRWLRSWGVFGATTRFYDLYIDMFSTDVNITGVTDAYGTGDDLCFLKLEGVTGGPVSATRLPDTMASVGRSVDFDPSSAGFLLSGYSTSYGAPGTDYIVSKTDVAGFNCSMLPVADTASSSALLPDSGLNLTFYVLPVTDTIDTVAFAPVLTDTVCSDIKVAQPLPGKAGFTLSFDGKRLSFGLTAGAVVDLRLYDVAGREAALLNAGRLPEGKYVYQPPVTHKGAFFVRAVVDGQARTLKIVLR